MRHSPSAPSHSSRPDVPRPRHRPPRLWVLVLLGTVLARITNEIESEALRWSVVVLSLTGVSVWCGLRFPPPRRWFVSVGTLLTLLLTLLFVRSAGLVPLLIGTLIASGVVYGYAYLSTWLVRPPDAPAASQRTTVARRAALALPLLAQLVVLIVAWSYAGRPAPTLDLVRQADSSRQIHAFPAGTNNVSLSPDGTRAVSMVLPDAAPDEPALTQAQSVPVSIWDVRTGTVIQTLHQSLDRADMANLVAMSRSGEVVAISNGAEIRVWQVDTGTLIAQLPPGHWTEGALEFSPDASMLAVVGSERDVVRLWSLRDGSLVRTLGTDAPGRLFNDLAFSPDGQLLALYHGRTVTIWRVADGARQRTLESTLFSILPTPSLAFSPDGQLLVVGGLANDHPTVAELWRVSDGVLLYTFRDTPTDAKIYWQSAVAFSADGTRLMTTTRRLVETDVALLFSVQDRRWLRSIDPAIGIDNLRFAPNNTEVLVTNGPHLFALPADLPEE